MSSSLPFNPLTGNQPPTPDHASEDANAVERRNRRLQAVPALLLVLVGVVALLLSIGPTESRPLISEVSLFVSMFFCFCCTLWAIARTPRGRVKWAWILLALAQLLYALGDVREIIRTFQSVSESTEVLPADLLQLPFAPLTALGALLFPTVQSSIARQVRIIVDVAIVVGALLGLAWAFLIAPHGLAGTTKGIFFTVVPIADAILLLVLLILLARGVQRAYQPVLLSLTIGMVCFIYADTAFNYLSLPALHIGPNYTAGVPYVDPFWVAGAFAFALAPLTLLRQWDNALPSWSWLGKLFPGVSRFLTGSLLVRLILTTLPVLGLFVLLVGYNSDPEESPSDFVLKVITVAVALLIITRQLLTMRDLVDARIATERAEQLDELKDQFITSVNHELRTPLMTMKGYLRLLADTTIQAPQEKRQDMLVRANRSCENLVYLVQSILDTRRIDQEASDFTPEAVNLQASVQAALTLIDPREADPSTRQIALSIPNDLAVWGESVRVQQILTNLITNAIKYSPADTPILVRAQQAVEKSHRLRGGKSSAQPMIEITVQDRGLGIPPEQKDLLFRRFVRLPRDIASTVHGTGLGLYLCRVFAEAMGGSAWVESAGVPGEGSTFHVRLPAPPESSMLAASLAAAEAH